MEPLADVVVLHTEVLHLVTDSVQVYHARGCEVHGVDDDVLDDLTLQTLVEEDVLYGARHVLVFCALHDREPAQFTAHRLTVAVEDVQVLFPRADDVAFENASAYGHTYLSPLVADMAVVVDEKPLVVRAVNEPERRAALREKSHDEETAVLARHFIDDVGVRMSEIELVERLLIGHSTDAELLLVGIVEKQNSAKDGGLSHTLCTYEVYVAVEVNLGIAYVGTVDKHNLIQVSHRSPPR